MSGFENTFEDKDLSDSQLEAPELDISGYQAVFWYGINSIAHASLAVIIYMLFNNNAVIRTYWETMLSHQFAYWPSVIGWAAIALFKNDFTMELYKATLGVSVLGPFAGHIIGFVYIFLNTDAAGLWDEWYMWLLWPLYLVYVIVQMLCQFLMLPQIYDWLDADMFEGISGLIN